MKKLLALLFVLGAVSLLLVGCSTPEEQTNDVPESAEEEREFYLNSHYDNWTFSYLNRDGVNYDINRKGEVLLINKDEIKNSSNDFYKIIDKIFDFVEGSYSNASNIVEWDKNLILLENADGAYISLSVDKDGNVIGIDVKSMNEMYSLVLWIKE